MLPADRFKQIGTSQVKIEFYFNNFFYKKPIQYLDKDKFEDNADIIS